MAKIVLPSCPRRRAESSTSQVYVFPDSFNLSQGTPLEAIGVGLREEELAEVGTVGV